MRRRLHRSFEDWVTIIGDGAIITVASVGLLFVIVAGIASGDVSLFSSGSDDDRRR